MARSCSVCGHKRRQEIDKALLAGEPLLALSRQYGLSRDALRRHQGSHLPAAAAKAQEAAEVVHGDSLLGQLTALQNEIHGIKTKALAAKDLRTALASIRELTRIVELTARIQGEIQETQVVNVLINPAWIDLRAVILKAVMPFPEARRAIISALEQPDAGR